MSDVKESQSVTIILNFFFLGVHALGTLGCSNSELILKQCSLRKFRTPWTGNLPKARDFPIQGNTTRKNNLPARSETTIQLFE
jgi:hypothetical protein